MPVCYNTWWPYEDKWINEEVFLENAREATAMGFTNTMLDAGWFGKSEKPDQRGNMPWYQKRGDWESENAALFPSGLAALRKKVQEEAGLPFGIWCEIEAVGSDAELKKKRPDLLAMKNGEILDYVCMGNAKAREWAHGIFRHLVEDYGAKWVKIDFNLDPVNCDCTAHGHGKGDGLYAHYRGLYQFMDELRAKYPFLIIENCSSGGLRGDWGIMQHCHYYFLSDPDYTRHHLQCLWGALSHFHQSGLYHFIQSETVCTHNIAWDEHDEVYSVYKPITVSTPPAALDYMVRSCFIGALGVSHKLPLLPVWAKHRLKEHINFYRSISRDYILNGDCFRLTGQTSSHKGTGEAWCAFLLRADRDRSILVVLKSDGGVNETTIRLAGLEEEEWYKLTFTDRDTCSENSGSSLMEQGISFVSESDEWSELVMVRRIT
jgi:alpha-galactosidase